MTANRTAPFFARLLPASDEPDAELVRRFAASRDAMAFEILVRRHGPSVFGICRRTLGHSHDAEDAFQAAFLVLAHKAGTIRDPSSLSAWLYGVAMRVAKKAKSRAANRREEARADVPEPMVMEREHDWETGRILDEELAALPEWYRQAILLCDVQELSRTEAATKLGIPEGTLSSRLAKGRKLLAARLKKRGVALSVPLMASIASASVPEKLIQHTLEILNVWTVGGTVAKPISELARGGTTMFAKVMLLGMSALAMTALGVGLADEPTKPEEKKAAVKAEAKPTEVSYGKPRLKKSAEVYMSRVDTLGWTPDGKQFWIQGHGVLRGDIKEGKPVLLQLEGMYFFTHSLTQNYDADIGFPSQRTQFIGFSADGRSIAVQTGERGKINNRMRWESIPTFDPAGLPIKRAEKEWHAEPTVTVVYEPEYRELLGFTNDNKSFVTTESGLTANPLHRKVVRRSAVTGDVEETLMESKNASPVYHSADFRNLAWLAIEQRTVGTGLGLPPEHKENYAAKVEVRVRGATPKDWSAANPEKYDISEVKFSDDGAMLLIAYRLPRARETQGRGALGGIPAEAKPKATEPQGILVGYETATGRKVFQFASETSYFEQLKLSHDRKLVAVAATIDPEPRPMGTFRGFIPPAKIELSIYETATGKLVKQWPVEGSMRTNQRSPTGAFSQSIYWAFSPTEPILVIVEPGEDPDHKSLGLWEFPTK